MMIMTEIELLGKLPEPYASQAIANYKRHSWNIGYVKYYIGGNELEIIYNLLHSGFSWYNSPEGKNYWIDFVDSLESQIK